MSPSEEFIQTQIVEHLRQLHVLFTATCGGIRASIAQKAKMKRTGYMRGVPDILIFEPVPPYHGLALEVKSYYGRPSAEQIQWIKDLTDRGYKAEFVYGTSHALRVIAEYFLNSNDSEEEEDDGIL